MLLIYVVVIALVAAAAFSTFRYFSLKKSLAGLFSLITVIIAIILTHVYIAPNYYTWRIESDLKSKFPVFQLLAEKSPDEFNTFVEKLKTDMLTSPNRYNEFRDIGTFLNSEMIKYSQTATNESLFNFAKSITDFYNKLFQIDPVFILNLEFPDKFGNKIDFDKLEAASKDSIQQITAAKEGIIRSAVDDPQPVLTDEEMQKAQAIFRQIVSDLVNKHGKDVVLGAFQHPDDPSTDKKVAATIIIEFYTELTARGEMDTGVVLKYLFKIGSASS